MAGRKYKQKKDGKLRRFFRIIQFNQFSKSETERNGRNAGNYKRAQNIISENDAEQRD